MLGGTGQKAKWRCRSAHLDYISISFEFDTLSPGFQLNVRFVLSLEVFLAVLSWMLWWNHIILWNLWALPTTSNNQNPCHCLKDRRGKHSTCAACFSAGSAHIAVWTVQPLHGPESDLGRVMCQVPRYEMKRSQQEMRDHVIIPVIIWSYPEISGNVANIIEDISDISLMVSWTAWTILNISCSIMQLNS